MRMLLEQFLVVFPTAAGHWKYYIELEMASKHYDKVEALFMRCLLQCLDISLWRSYIKYMSIVKKGQHDEIESMVGGGYGACAL